MKYENDQPMDIPQYSETYPTNESRYDTHNDQYAQGGSEINDE